MREVLIAVFMITLLSVQLLAANSSADVQSIDTLPWELINRNDVNAVPDANFNYAYKPGERIEIELPDWLTAVASGWKIKINVAKWFRDSWQNMNHSGVLTATDRIELSSGFESEGLFRLKVIKKTLDGQSVNFQTYIIISENWKKDILAFCRNLKEEIELNPDPKLIFSSIAISHFDNTMEMVSNSSFLSWKILKALSDALESKKVFEAGRCPDFVRGALNKLRLKRFEGAEITEFVLVVSTDYDSSRKWPLFVHMERTDKAVEGMIDLAWLFLSPLDFEWKDYEYFMNLVKDKLNIDENKIYLYGYCANGISAMALALKYPDRWAECSMSLGNSFRHLAGNAFNLPIIFTLFRDYDAPEFVGYYNFAVKSFQYYGCRYFKYSKTKNIEQVRGSRFPKSVRVCDPNRVLYTTESLGNPKSYWVKIDGREDENLIATIDARVDAQKILVKTTNIDAYSLDLSLARLDSNQPIEIIENGKSLGLTNEQIFSRKSEKYSGSSLIKNEHLHGPVWDAFTDAYVVVWGSGGEDKEFCKINKETAKSIAGGGPCFSDTNVPEELLLTHNLILIGTARTNNLLAKINRQLPVRINDGHVKANGEIYAGQDAGYIIIYPNPLNFKRYVAVFSATSSRAMREIPMAYLQMKKIQVSDVGIFELEAQGQIKWQIMEKFNTVWDWHDEWGQVVAVTAQKHPKWQWRQWSARVIRKQLKADVVICEDTFKSENLVPVGQITYRDIFNSFCNVWMVKISLDGKSLRKMLSVTFDDTAKQEVTAPIIDGLSRFKSQKDSEDKILVLNELKDEKRYTIALPYKAINGQRMGVLLENYEIAGEGFLFSLLKDYFCEKNRLDIDAELDCLKVNMF